MNLIKFSKEKGFISRDKLVDIIEPYYYLWMCELQKWLRQVHKINVYVAPCDSHSGCDYLWCVYKIKSCNKYYNTYEKALEDGLLEGLKQIK